MWVLTLAGLAFLCVPCFWLLCSCVLRLYRLSGSFAGGLGTASLRVWRQDSRPYNFQQVHHPCRAGNSWEAIPWLSISSLQNGHNRPFSGHCGMHWQHIHEACSKEKGYMSPDEFYDKVCPKCEHWKDECTLGFIDECEQMYMYRCPYESDVSECPRIRRWKRHASKASNHGHDK